MLFLLNGSFSLEELCVLQIKSPIKLYHVTWIEIINFLMINHLIQPFNNCKPLNVSAQFRKYYISVVETIISPICTILPSTLLPHFCLDAARGLLSTNKKPVTANHYYIYWYWVLMLSLEDEATKLFQRFLSSSFNYETNNTAKLATGTPTSLLDPNFFIVYRQKNFTSSN